MGRYYVSLLLGLGLLIVLGLWATYALLPPFCC
jgi:hypothetical protein